MEEEICQRVNQNGRVYTADKTWKGLKLNVRIHVIR
jgi:PIN domain nuclease of toxin-antitoxin system